MWWLWLCAFLILFVSVITPNVLNGFYWHFQETIMGQGPDDDIFCDVLGSRGILAFDLPKIILCNIVFLHPVYILQGCHKVCEEMSCLFLSAITFIKGSEGVHARTHVRLFRM